MVNISITALYNLDRKGIIYIDKIMLSKVEDTSPPDDPEIISPSVGDLGEGLVIFEWRSYDESGIAGYSYQLDQIEDTDMDDTIESGLDHKFYQLTQGKYFFHVAAIDNLGNQSDTTHFELNISPHVFLIDDFEHDDADHNSIGPPIGPFGGMDVWKDDGHKGSQLSYVVIGAPEPGEEDRRLPGSEYSLIIGCQTSNTDVESFAGYYSGLSYFDWKRVPINVDLSSYSTLSFWVKWERGDPKLWVGFRNAYDEKSGVRIQEYVDMGRAGEWQKVVIPFHEMIPRAEDVFPISDWSRMSEFFIEFAAGGLQRIVIDNIEIYSEVTTGDDFEEPLPPDDRPFTVIEEGDATITVAYDSTETYGGSANSLRMTYDAPKGDVATWLRGFGSIDVSTSSALNFYIKGSGSAVVDEGTVEEPDIKHYDGVFFEVWLQDLGNTRGVVAIQDVITVRDDKWQLAKVPLADFSRQGVDLSRVEALEFKFHYYGDTEGTVYIDNIEFKNNLFKPRSAGTVSVSGTSLIVNRNQFTVKSVGYQPIPIGEDVSYDVFSDTATNRKIWARDLPIISNLGFNTIRTWARISSRAFLDECAANGIYVIMGYPLNNSLDLSIIENRISLMDDFSSYVDTYKDHPAVLMWAVGNEDNYHYMGDGQVLIGEDRALSPFYTMVNEMARAAYETEGPSYHPVMFPNGDRYYIGRDSFFVTITVTDADGQREEEYMRKVRASDTSMNYLDIWGANVYRGPSFGTFFSEYKARSDKPLIITEYGTDSFDNRVGAETDESMGWQADYAVSLWTEIVNCSFCIGGSLMAYSDEWWKAGDPSSHDSGGYQLNAHEDEYANEEYWGIVRFKDGTDQLEKKPVYYDLSGELNPQLIIDNFNDGDTTNELGGVVEYFADNDTGTIETYNADTANVFGGEGYSLKLDWDVTEEESWGGFWLDLEGGDSVGVDARSYHTLSFWIKGANGGEKFVVSMRGEDIWQEGTIGIENYAPGGITNEWRKIELPLEGFTHIEAWDDIWVIAFGVQNVIGSGSGTLYIDDIKLEEEPSSIMIDNFEDGIRENGVQGDRWTLTSGQRPKTEMITG